MNKWQICLQLQQKKFYQISESGEEVDPVNVGLRREVDEEGVKEEWGDGVKGMRAGDDVDDRKAASWRNPFPETVRPDVPRDVPEDDEEEEHPQVDVIIVHVG